jgi:hypothetical protein
MDALYQLSYCGVLLFLVFCVVFGVLVMIARARFFFRAEGSHLSYCGVLLFLGFLCGVWCFDDDRACAVFFSRREF